MISIKAEWWFQIATWGLEVPPRGVAGNNRNQPLVSNPPIYLVSFAMTDPPIFPTMMQSNGVLVTTFHGQILSPGEIDGLTVPPLSFAFKIINGSVQSQVEGGILTLSEERARVLDLAPGVQFTALKVQPKLLEECHGKHCLIQLQADDQPQLGSLVKHPFGLPAPVILDVCSGMGGWHFGGQPYGFQPSISIECDPEVAHIGSYNLKSTWVSAQRVASASNSEIRQWISTGMTIQAEFQDEIFWEKASCRGINVIVASLPCPPWSSLAKGNGLKDPRGSIFRDFRFLVHVFRPAIVALENVKGLIMHQDWDCIKKWFHEIGFVCSHVSVDPLHSLLPMHRDRASIVFANRSHHADLTSMIIKPTPMPQLPTPPLPGKLEVFHDEVPEILHEAVTILPEHMEILTDFAVWPKTWKLKYPRTSPKHVDIRERSISKTKPLPCAVAKYGQPDKIERDLLCQKGLYMCVITTPTADAKARWISPCEIMLALGFPKHTMISRNHILSYHILGNSVSPLHAMMTIARIATIYPKCVKVKPDLFQAIMMALAQVPKMNQSILQWDESVMWFEDKINVSQSIPLCCDDLPSHDPFSPATKRLKTEQAALTCLADSDNAASEAFVTTVAPVVMKDEDAAPTQIDLTGDSQHSSCDMQPPDPPLPVPVLSDISIEMVPQLSHYHEAVSFYLIDFGHFQQFADHHTITPQWMTGFAPRSDRELFTDPDPSKCKHTVKIFDIQKSWVCKLHCDTVPTIETAMQWINPFCDKFHFEGFQIDGLLKQWKDPCDGCALQVTPFKMRLNLAISGTHEVHHIFCDPFDTIESISREYPFSTNLGHHTGLP